MQPITLLDPDVFISTFAYDKDATKFLLQTVMDAFHTIFSLPLDINHVSVYKNGFSRSDGSLDQSIIIYACDTAGYQYDFDIMIADEINFESQARVHSNNLAVNERFSEDEHIEDFILLFTAKTLLGFDLPLAVIEWTLTATGEVLNRTDHILIINCEHDTRTLSHFHDMIHDMRQCDPEEMFSFELKRALLKAIKNNK